jgi:hypothetical protein
MRCVGVGVGRARSEYRVDIEYRWKMDHGGWWIVDCWERSRIGSEARSDIIPNHHATPVQVLFLYSLFPLKHGVLVLSSAALAFFCSTSFFFLLPSSERARDS